MMFELPVDFHVQAQSSVDILDISLEPIVVSDVKGVLGYVWRRCDNGDAKPKDK